MIKVLEWATVVIFALIAVLATALAYWNREDTFACLILIGIASVGTGGAITYYKRLKEEDQ